MYESLTTVDSTTTRAAEQFLSNVTAASSLASVLGETAEGVGITSDRAYLVSSLGDSDFAYAFRGAWSPSEIAVDRSAGSIKTTWVPNTENPRWQAWRHAPDGVDFKAFTDALRLLTRRTNARVAVSYAPTAPVDVVGCEGYDAVRIAGALYVNPDSRLISAWADSTSMPPGAVAFAANWVARILGDRREAVDRDTLGSMVDHLRRTGAGNVYDVEIFESLIRSGIRVFSVDRWERRD
jgi:hypothetical protein